MSKCVKRRSIKIIFKILGRLVVILKINWKSTVEKSR